MSETHHHGSISAPEIALHSLSFLAILRDLRAARCQEQYPFHSFKVPRKTTNFGERLRRGMPGIELHYQIERRESF